MRIKSCKRCSLTLRHQAQVTPRLRYVSAIGTWLFRMDQLNYQDALNKALPIGSGEIESAHRYVVQKWLKLPGCWWLIPNAEHMLALRINRANRKWHAYWMALAGNKSPEFCTPV